MPSMAPRAPIAEQAGQADAEDGAIEPGLFLWGIGHGGVVYSRQFTVNSKSKSKRRKSRRTARLFLCGAVEDDADFLESDEAAIDHFV